MRGEKQRSEPAYIQKRKNAERKEWERQQHQDNVEIVHALNSLSNQIAANEQEEDRDHRKKGWREWLTIFLIFATVLATGIGDRIFYTTMKDARRVAKRAHDDNIQTIIATQRAWVKVVDVSVAPGAGLIINENGASLPLLVVARNTGNSPALSGRWHVALIPGPGGIGWNAVKNRKVSGCAEIKKSPVLGGETIFPNENYPHEGGGSSEITASATLAEMTNMLNRGQPYPTAFDLRVEGCFDYTFSADATNHHQTTFSMPIIRKGFMLGQMPPFDFQLNMGTIPAENIFPPVGDITSSAD